MRKIYILITIVFAGFQAHSQGTRVGDANSPIYHYNGNVGIGTSGPSDKLEVIGAVRIRNSNSTNSWTGITTLGLGASRAQSSGFILSYEADENPRVGRISLTNNWAGIYGDFAISTRDNTGVNERLRIKYNGNVGIGTTTPDYKLDVLGTVRANEVKVATGWSDFVFEPGSMILPAGKPVSEQPLLPGKTQVNNWKTALMKLMTCLTKLDVLMELVKRKCPELCNQYQRARVIVDR